MSFQDGWSHFTRRNVVFPLPDFEVFQVVNLVVLLNLQHPAFGQSVSSAHRGKTTTTAEEAERLGNGVDGSTSKSTTVKECCCGTLSPF